MRNKNIIIIIIISLCLSNILIIIPSEKIKAASYNGEDLALAILKNSSWLVSSSYSDCDQYGYSQSAVLSNLGTMYPTHGSTFALLSTGIAGTDIITTDEEEPGDERGSWFAGGGYGYPRDEATLTLILQVPEYMHYLYYDVQFFSSEYPEYVGTQYNDKLTITVNSPSEGISNYVFDVNSGYFLLDSKALDDTGFDIFARSGYPGGVDWVDTYERQYGADAGASDLIQIGGMNHPVSPNEQITVTFNIKDCGDNLFDSAAFIDNLEFTGYAKTDISARKTVQDINGEPTENTDILNYRVTISNTGKADQDNNLGHEFIDNIPDNTTYVSNSATSTSGSINYDSNNDRIIWNGEIPGESSVILEFQVQINDGLANGTIISNQGTVNWDSNEDGSNDAIELTDNAYIDDGIDQDGDGETDDDDPTDVTIIEFEYPSEVTEDFSDDQPGKNATQKYFGRQWFDTSFRNNKGGSTAKVVSGYYYQTARSFKTKLREYGSPQYWNYTFSELDGDMISWETYFTCGDSSEYSDLYLDLKNNNGQNIARLRFEYIEQSQNYPLNWFLELSYYDDSQPNDWVKLNSDFENGYLRNSWYKIKIEKEGANHINYTLERTGIGQVDSDIGNKLSASFNNFAQVKFYNTIDPIVCPMFFWDEHTIGLS